MLTVPGHNGIGAGTGKYNMGEHPKNENSPQGKSFAHI
jgi:hypothetical protein